MRRLVKQKCPEILEQNHKAWTTEYLNIISSNGKPTKTQSGRYRHPQIKQTILLETHGKCVYCESKVTHIYPGDIEHIKPKSLYPTEIFSWLNLTLACSICNTNKAAYPNPVLSL
ncbi:hypothetical protein A6769_33265 [Nostoc punctiforme NIES-2108]|uniref:HNH domain-containing protein n=1 Tax=Nostoc punctiforme NIES-2108 TaxID=1356359 RepID=A0A367R2V2_NOSPU|nr:hypothetical protein A6769_33265 [Nostoc punctiforme NIES-2108]